jgi:hypothetical protein
MTRFSAGSADGRRTLKTLLVAALVTCSVFAAACGGTSIRKITADPSRYRTNEVKISGEVLDSYSIGSRGIYHVDDGSGRLWVYSDNGVPRKGAQVTVWGTIREAVNLGPLNNLVKIPVDAIILVERQHRAQ